MPAENDDKKPRDLTPGEGPFLIEDDDPIDQEDTTVETTPAKRKPSPYVISLARDLGVSEADIANSSADELDFVVTQLSRQQIAASRGQQPKQDEPAPRPKSKARLHAEKLKAEGYDDVFVQAFNDIADEQEAKDAEHEKTLREYRAEVLNLQESGRRNSQQEFDRQCEAAFTALNLPDIFGSGTFGELDQDEKDRRLTVVRAALERQKVSGGDLGQLIGKVTRVIYRRKPKKAAAEPVDPSAPIRVEPAKKPTKAEEWREASLPKPTRRGNSPEPTGKAEAVAALKKRFRELNG